MFFIFLSISAFLLRLVPSRPVAVPSRSPSVLSGLWCGFMTTCARNVQTTRAAHTVLYCAVFCCAVHRNSTNVQPWAGRVYHRPKWGETRIVVKVS